MAIRRMRIACWIPKATNTHSEYVILSFPLRQWLFERASVLRYTYIACLVKYHVLSTSDSFTPKSRVQLQAIPCEICRTGAGFTLGTSVLSCQSHSTNARYSSLSTPCSYQDKRAKPGNIPPPPKKLRFFGNRRELDRKCP
jgi:hypothetical protein